MFTGWTLTRSGTVRALLEDLRLATVRARVAEMLAEDLAAEALSTAAAARRLRHDNRDLAATVTLLEELSPLIDEAISALARGEPEHTVVYAGDLQGIGQMYITFRSAPWARSRGS